MVLLSLLTAAQFTRQNQNFSLNYMSGLTYASGLSCYDFNHDGWDDITVATNTDGVRTFLNNQGQFEEIYLFNNIQGQIRGVTWVDFDNDDDEDLFVSRYNNSLVILRNDGDMIFTDVSFQTTMPSTNANSHMMSWGDYDLDGLLDAYVCNYHVAGNNRSWLMHNLGGGSFENVALLLNVSNGVKPAWQSSWFDVDQDLDPDLLVINDRYAGNSFYLNNGDGSFTNAGATTGLDIALDGMGISWSDIDHDLDYDVYISNTELGSLLLKNDNMVFSDHASSASLDFVGATLYGVEWIDYDNDTDDDFYGATNTAFDGGQNYFCTNIGNANFDMSNSPAFEDDDGETYVTATGDFNRDGFADLVVVNIIPQKIDVWINDAVGGNWIKFDLKGTVSNRNAVGTHIHVYANGQEYITYTQSGESFMGQDSQYEIFGLADATIVDSVMIQWPLGWSDKYYNLNINQVYQFIEGSTYIDAAEYFTRTLCANDSLILSNDQGSSGAWSNGTTGESLLVFEHGIYEQVVASQNGFDHHIFFEVIDFIPNDIEMSITPVSCFGLNDASVQLIGSVDSIVHVNWSFDNAEFYAEALSAGEYDVTLTFENGCRHTILFSVPEPLPLVASVVNDTICIGAVAAASVEVFGGSGNYFFDWYGQDQNALNSGVHHFSVVDDHGCAWFDSVRIDEFTPPEIEWNIPTACSNESVAVTFEEINGVEIVFADFKGENAQQMFEGIHEAILLDEFGCHQIQTFEVLEFDPIQVVADIFPASNASGGIVQLTVSGGAPPYSILWGNGASDFYIENLLPGMYDFQISDTADCQFQDQIEIVFDGINENILSLKVYPNPLSDVLNIETFNSAECFIRDVSGRVVLSQQLFAGFNTIETSFLSSGIYLLECQNETILLEIQ